MLAIAPRRLFSQLASCLVIILLSAAGCGDLLGPASNGTPDDQTAAGRTSGDDPPGDLGGQPEDSEITVATGEGETQKPQEPDEQGTPPALPENEFSDSNPEKDDPSDGGAADPPAGDPGEDSSEDNGDDSSADDDPPADDDLPVDDDPPADDPPADDPPADDPPADDPPTDDPPADDPPADDPPADDPPADDPPDSSGDDDDGSADPSLDFPDNEYCSAIQDWDDAWTQFEDQVLALVNEQRAAGADCGPNGSFAPVPPLVMDPALRCAARNHSLDMHVREFFSHVNPDGDGPGQRIGYAEYDYSTWGENIAGGYTTPQAVVQGWMDSPGHCQNIMRDTFTEIGVGYHPDNLWTQNFGRP